jgi:putative ABC transport system permease protein
LNLLLLNPHLHRVDKIAYIKLPTGKFQEKIASIEKKWKAVFPNTGFDHWFLSNEFNRMYLAEGRVSSLAKAFAVLAILITILGVFWIGILHGGATYERGGHTQSIRR